MRGGEEIDYGCGYYRLGIDDLKCEVSSCRGPPYIPFPWGRGIHLARYSNVALPPMSHDSHPVYIGVLLIPRT